VSSRPLTRRDGIWLDESPAVIGRAFFIGDAMKFIDEARIEVSAEKAVTAVRRSVERSSYPRVGRTVVTAVAAAACGRGPIAM